MHLIPHVNRSCSITSSERFLSVGVNCFFFIFLFIHHNHVVFLMLILLKGVIKITYTNTVDFQMTQLMSENVSVVLKVGQKM